MEQLVPGTGRGLGGPQEGIPNAGYGGVEWSLKHRAWGRDPVPLGFRDALKSGMTFELY